MQLPAENATTAEIKSFISGLSTDRQLRLAAAIIADTIKNSEGGEVAEELEDEIGTLAAGLTEFGAIDHVFSEFADAVYQQM